MPVMLPRERFDALVDQAVNGLPDWVALHMQNVYITTALWPTVEQQRTAALGEGQVLLGLYEGIPLTRRGGGYHLRAPDRITLFQRPLELVAADEADLVELIRRTVIHEIAHHFGFSEGELQALEPKE